METKLKVTVVRKLTPEEILGEDHGITRNGRQIRSCDHELGEEFIVDHHLNRPEGLCGQAWHDLYTTLMVYYFGGDYDYPETGVTYQPCGDGLRPVVFKIEKMEE